LSLSTFWGVDMSMLRRTESFSYIPVARGVARLVSSFRH
jgi:hypothetical protein